MSIYSSADSSELMLGVTKRCLGIARLAAVSHSRDGHSFNCKCSIPSSYPASHCPGIAGIFGGPSGNRGDVGRKRSDANPRKQRRKPRTWVLGFGLAVASNAVILRERPSSLHLYVAGQSGQAGYL